MPKPGAVYRPENAPGIVFEEVTVKSVGQSRPGPSGPISGVMVVNELHQDGTREDKAFAPGYGGFSTGNPAGDLEAVTLGIPVDARPGGVPRSLMSVPRAARATYDAIAAGRWHDARAAHQMLTKAFRSTGTVLDRQMARDIRTLGQAIDKPRSARQAALRVAQDELDLRLRYLPLPTIERARFDLWTRQIAVDAKARDLSAVRGDVATLEWTWHRIKPTLTPSQAARIDQQLKTLRTAASRHDLPTTTHTAARVRAMV